MADLAGETDSESTPWSREPTGSGGRGPDAIAHRRAVLDEIRGQAPADDIDELAGPPSIMRLGWADRAVAQAERDLAEADAGLRDALSEAAPDADGRTLMEAVSDANRSQRSRAGALTPARARSFTLLDAALSVYRAAEASLEQVRAHRARLEDGWQESFLDPGVRATFAP